MASPKHVLIVDGNPVDGQLACAILERLGTGYACEVVTTHQHATERISKRSYDLIILETDIQGHLDGLKLAQLILMRERSRAKASSPVIILISSRRDRETIQQVASLGIANFIAKPYYPRTLLERIEKSLLAKQEMGEDEFTKNLLKTLKDISGIPTLSVVFAKVQALLGAPEPSIDEVSRVIEADPAITMRVLRLANSAYFGFSKTVKTMKQAVSLLGFQTIRNAVMAASTFDALGKGTDSAGLDKTGIWRHSVGCGEIASLITKKLNLTGDDGFVGGLLHDVGKIVLDTFFSEYYVPVLDVVRSRDISIAEAEQEILGLSHAEVGGHLASMWNLPPDLINFIRFHHQPMVVDENIRSTMAIIYVSNALCRKIGIGQPGDMTIPPIDDEVLEYLKIQPDDLESWLPELKEQAEKATDFLMATTGV